MDNRPEPAQKEQALLESIKVAVIDSDGSLYLYDAQGKDLPWPRTFPNIIQNPLWFCHCRGIKLIAA